MSYDPYTGQWIRLYNEEKLRVTHWDLRASYSVLVRKAQNRFVQGTGKACLSLTLSRSSLFALLNILSEASVTRYLELEYDTGLPTQGSGDHRYALERIEAQDALWPQMIVTRRVAFTAKTPKWRTCPRFRGTSERRARRKPKVGKGEEGKTVE